MNFCFSFETRFCALFVPGMFISANENYDNNEVATDYRDAPFYKKYKDLVSVFHKKSWPFLIIFLR
jgi:hypothetical protein